MEEKMTERYFRINGLKYADPNDSTRDFLAWEFILQSAVNNLEMFRDLLWLRNEKVTITPEGKLDFYWHVGGDIDGEGVQDYIRAVKRELYRSYGKDLANLLKQASKLVDVEKN